MTLPNLVVIGTWCILRLVLERNVGQEIPESSKLEFLEKFSANDYAEDNTLGPINTGGVAYFPLLRTLLVIRQKSLEPSF